MSDLTTARFVNIGERTNVTGSARFRKLIYLRGEKHRNRAREIGVDRYLVKPYQEDQLLATIEALLRERKERAAARPQDSSTAGQTKQQKGQVLFILFLHPVECGRHPRRF